MIDPALAGIAEQFWTDADGHEPFPRGLEDAVLWTLPLAVLKVPRLSVADVRRWLAERGIAISLCAPDRSLYACLIARGGGCVLLDGSDAPAERRYSLAHEVAHYLIECHHPRLRAMDRLGPSIVDVLDGRRPPTSAERIDAVLANAPIGVVTHLMDRRPDGSLGCGRAGRAEGDADQPALELLAPAAVLLERLTSVAAAAPRDLAARAVTLLLEDFGLPLSVARPYARALAATLGDRRTARAWLGL